MKKKLINVSIFCALCAGTVVYAQQGSVGINTDEPKATLHIKPYDAKETATNNEGIIVPILSKKRVANIAEPQEGTLIYVNNSEYDTNAYNATQNHRVSRVGSSGYYWYNGDQWVNVLYTAGQGMHLGANEERTGVQATEFWRWGLDRLTQENKTGLAIIGRPAANFGNIGDNAVDVSYSQYTVAEATDPAHAANNVVGKQQGETPEAKGATGNYAFAAGWNTVASGEASFAAGKGSFAKGRRAVAIGADTYAIGDRSVAMGNESYAKGSNSVAMGTRTMAMGSASVAMGGENTASGRYSTAMGYKNTTQGNYSFSVGRENMVTENAISSTAMGYKNTVSANYSTAIGSNNTASGYASVAIGSNNTATAPGSMALGVENTVKSYGAFVTGSDATLVSEERDNNGNPKYYSYRPGGATTGGSITPFNARLFTLGNGGNTTGQEFRSDAFMVLRSGRTGINIDQFETVAGDAMLVVNGAIQIRRGGNTNRRADDTVDDPAANMPCNANNEGSIRYFSGSSSGYFQGCIKISTNTYAWRRLPMLSTEN